MSEELLSKAYEPSEVEEKWYKIWEERGYFHGSPESEKQPYTIVIPPPNVTGILTLGHVLNETLQDILIRFEKLRGRETCWVPGTDHAGIATQAKVEAALKKEENLTRYDLGREKFLERVWDWKEKYGGTIIRQLRTIGCACDWERERFTMDPGLSDAVKEVFIRLYEKGLIYKGHRIINWCPKSRTALSDEEVIYKTERGHLWYFRYPFEDGSGYVTVATTRPETMMGDTAVAVNPGDERYRDKVGKMLLLPIMNRRIPLVADEYVEADFGTGAVKITPAHDPNDYALGERHQLEVINLMNEDATMNENAGPQFQGMDRMACRKAVVAEMERLGFLEKVEDYTHEVGYSERGNVPVEPRVSDQWFVKMEPLAKPALQVVEEGKIHFYPERWVKTYRHWMENIKDWCISRQLWWGHRIPAYYCDQCGEVVVAREMPSVCPKCGKNHFTQDPDVLDTWFSSWLWPFSVLGWKKETPELKKFFPTQTLVTGPDIIFFWVARMIMSSLEFTGEIPFKDVYFTSIIRDAQGRKLSKSLNNSPDPLEVIRTYGADALRFTMIYITPLGQDIRYSNEKCEIGRNFANKIWNVVRFRLRKGRTSGWGSLDGLRKELLRPDDQWILFELNETVKLCTRALEEFRFDEMCRGIYEFIWNKFCDWYLESCKSVFSEETLDVTGQNTLKVFDFVLGSFLRLLHPLMPFLTDELAHQMGFVAEEDSIMKSRWPEVVSGEVLEGLGVTAAHAEMTEARCELIRGIRTLRANYQISPSVALDLHIDPATDAAEEFLTRGSAALRKLANAANVEIRRGCKPEGACGVAVSAMATAYVPLKGIVDLDAEIQRLTKQEGEMLKYLDGVKRKLSNESFVARAPKEVVEAERAKITDGEAKLARIREQLAAFRG